MSDTGPAKLPGLPALKNADPALQRWAQAVAEHLEVRAGARGNPAERSVTQRELLAATKGLDALRSDKSTTINAGDVILNLGGGLTVAVAMDAFAKSIFDSPLYKSLMKRLDDQSRFDDVPEEVRKILLMDIAEEAARRGADIVRLDKKIQTSTQSLAYTVEEVTAAIAKVSAGVRETTYASASANLATAGKVTQVQARLDNFAGGGPGTATIEQKMSTIASNVTGLSAEYTLKVQAGGIFGGIGLSAHLPADPTKPGYSMFLIAVDKFGLVFPGNVGGADVKRIPFGIDANGIYMNSDVYIKGTMRVDAGGKTLADGLRGSFNIGISGSAWSDALARNAIYSALGRGPSAPGNGHLVIGDSVTITQGASSVTKYWNDSGWAVPGVVINGDMIVDGGLAASKIDTRGLVVRDAAGNPILGSGYKLATEWINGLGSLATKNGLSASEVTGLNALAKLIGPITAENIGNFMSSAAIGSAYIGDAAVGTLKIGANAVTVPASGSTSCSLYMPHPGRVYVTANVWMYETSPSDGGAVLAAYSLQINASTGGSGGYCINHQARARHTTTTTACLFDVPAGWTTFSSQVTQQGGGNFGLQGATIMAIGTMK